MRTGAKVFLGSALFSAAIGLLYWLVSREPAGTALLASMFLAPGMLAVYTGLMMRGRKLPPEDRAGAGPADGADEPAGTFAVASAWPIILGAGSLLVAAGLAYGVWLLLPAAALFTLALVGLARE
jgi:hypothetical protein